MSVDSVTGFVHLVFLGVIALFPVYNPIGTAFVINPLFDGESKENRAKYVMQVAFLVFYFSVVIAFSGHWILKLFGISVPIVRIMGGLVIMNIGWRMLNGKDEHVDGTEHIEDESGEADNQVHKANEETKHATEKKAHNTQESVASKLLYPITFPMTAGPGVISVLLTLSSHSSEKGFTNYVYNMSAVILSILIMCVVIYFIYKNTNWITEKLGEKNKQIINKIMSFIILCVGAEISVTGLMSIIETHFK